MLSAVLYFLWRSLVLCFKWSLILFWPMAIYSTYDRYSFYGNELFTDQTYLGLWRGDLIDYGLAFCIYIFPVLWLIWAIFIFHFPAPPNTFTQDDPRLAKIPRTPEGRFVCEPHLRRLDGYYSAPKKAHFYRKGEQLPSHIKLIRVPDNVVLEFKNHLMSELKTTMRIDLLNHGYNALIDCSFWTERWNGINVTCVCGRPALLVSTKYPGNLDLLEDHCIDSFDNLIYGSALYNQDP